MNEVRALLCENYFAKARFKTGLKSGLRPKLIRTFV